MRYREMDSRIRKTREILAPILTGSHVPDEVLQFVKQSDSALDDALAQVRAARQAALAGQPQLSTATTDDVDSDADTNTAASAGSVGVKQVWALGFIDAQGDAAMNTLHLIDSEELFEWIGNYVDEPPAVLFEKMRQHGEQVFTREQVLNQITPGTYSHDKAHLVANAYGADGRIPVNDDGEVWATLRAYLAEHPELELVDRFDSYHY